MSRDDLRFTVADGERPIGGGHESVHIAPTREIDEGIPTGDEGVAHVDHVRVREVHDDVAVRVRRRDVECHHVVAVQMKGDRVVERDDRERAAQAGPTGFEVSLGPEQLDQRLPGVSAVQEAGQVAQQSSDLPGERTRALLAGKDDTQLAQQLDAAGGLRRRRGQAATILHLGTSWTARRQTAGASLH